MAIISVLTTPRQRGRTVGFVDMSVGTPYLLALGVLPLVARLLPFETVLIIPAWLSLLIALIIYLFMDRVLDLGEAVAADSETRDPEETTPVLLGHREVLTNRAVILIALIGFLGFAAGDAMVVWLPSCL